MKKQLYAVINDIGDILFESYDQYEVENELDQLTKAGFEVSLEVVEVEYCNGSWIEV